MDKLQALRTALGKPLMITSAYRSAAHNKRVGGAKRINTVCHSFVCDGQIQFLGDCTHALAGQTVPLPPFPDASDV